LIQKNKKSSTFVQGVLANSSFADASSPGKMMESQSSNLQTTIEKRRDIQKDLDKVLRKIVNPANNSL